MTTVAINADDEDGYPHVLVSMRMRFESASTAPALFTTDVSPDEMWAAYLDNLPDNRQHYTCYACRDFIKRYGGLVIINGDGSTDSALWDAGAMPPFFAASIDAMRRLVVAARVNGVYRDERHTWGTPITGDWTHFSVNPPARHIHTSKAQTAYQAAAEKAEDYKTVQRALAGFAPAMIDQAVRVLESDQLYRTEKVIGPAKWLQQLQATRTAARNARQRENLTWLAVSTAPAGFCHPRSSMIGTLLEDIAAGLSFEDVSRRFAAKMHPLQYQRPQAAPSAGTIAQAESLFEKMGLAAALRRRFARLDEIDAIWRPAQPATPTDGTGLFAHIKPKGKASAVKGMAIPMITMTWEKFSRSVLSSADAIELLTPDRGNYAAFVTAADPDAPPILQWDCAERRNPVSWYLWHGGSSASQWGLSGDKWHAVTAIALNPSQWHGATRENAEKGAMLIIKGAQETRVDRTGLALFPETIRSELHGVRSVIEAYSRSGTLEGVETASACGLMIGTRSPINVRLRVTSGGNQQEYKLDRWD